ncbi:hypothetical protein FQR65_LT04318 [Abscondita terminalis]|nr:hypothetical protein FQR65_LT04318 [Abscondita terminalis]
MENGKLLSSNILRDLNERIRKNSISVTEIGKELRYEALRPQSYVESNPADFIDQHHEVEPLIENLLPETYFQPQPSASSEPEQIYVGKEANYSDTLEGRKIVDINHIHMEESIVTMLSLSLLDPIRSDLDKFKYELKM